jgi:hypothetical protein
VRNVIKICCLLLRFKKATRSAEIGSRDLRAPHGGVYGHFVGIEQPTTRLLLQNAHAALRYRCLLLTPEDAKKSTHDELRNRSARICFQTNRHHQVFEKMQVDEKLRIPTTVNSLVAPPELKISCLFVNTTKHILFRFQRGRVNFSVGQDQIMICGQRGDVGVCLFEGHETIRRRRLKTL